jgi:hypothetical protein
MYFLVKKRSIPMFLILVSSLALCILLTKISAKSAFFLIPTRVWEFLIGFFALSLQPRIQTFQPKTRNLISVVSIIGLIYYSTISIPQDNYPGLYALPPVILAFLVILCGLHKDNLLCSQYSPVRFIGKISYSAYLCHFPIIFLFIYAPFSEWKPLTTLNIILAAILTLVISILTYYLIEEPFRKRTFMSNKTFVFSGASAFAFCFIALIALAHNNFYIKDFSTNEKRVFFSVNDQGDWRCHSIKSILDRKDRVCNLTQLKNPKNSILLVGDSHIDAIKSIFVANADKYATDIYLLKESCILGIDECSAKGLIQILQSHKIKSLVLHGYKPARFDFIELDKFYTYAHTNGISIYFIEPVPTYGESVPKIIYDEIVSGRKSLLRYDREDYLKRLDPHYIMFKASQVEKNKLVRFYSIVDILCPKACILEGDDGIYYHDSHHLSLTGTRHFQSITDDILANNAEENLH